MSQSVSVALEVAAHVLQDSATERQRVDTDPDACRDARRVGGGKRIDEGLDGGERQHAACRRQCRVLDRGRPAAPRARCRNFGFLPSWSSAVPVSRMARASGPYVYSTCSKSARAADAFTFVDVRHGTATEPRPSVAVRATISEPSNCGLPSSSCNDAIRLDDDRVVGRVDAEAQLHRAVRPHTACADAIAVAFAGKRETALALRRADERAQVTLEPETLGSGRRARSPRP